MDYGPLFSGTRWQIIEALSQKRHSPLELSIALKTTLANVSQQLRLLEMAGLVSTQRISQRDKGKPRLLYSIKEDFGYLILLSQGNAKKSLVALSELQKYTLASWQAPAEMHAALAAFFPKVEAHLDHIESIFLSKNELTIVSDSKDAKKLDGQTIGQKCQVKVTETAKVKAQENVIFLHRRKEVM